MLIRCLNMRKLLDSIDDIDLVKTLQKNLILIFYLNIKKLFLV
jgi:hypothetical protein